MVKHPRLRLRLCGVDQNKAHDTDSIKRVLPRMIGASLHHRVSRLDQDLRVVHDHEDLAAQDFVLCINGCGACLPPNAFCVPSTPKSLHAAATCAVSAALKCGTDDSGRNSMIRKLDPLRAGSKGIRVCDPHTSTTSLSLPSFAASWSVQRQILNTEMLRTFSVRNVICFEHDRCATRIVPCYESSVLLPLHSELGA